MKCKMCGSDNIRYPKKQLCASCYNKEYFKSYYQKNKDVLIARAKKHHIDNRDRRLLEMKEYREKKNFDSKRLQVLKRDNYTCITCGNKFESSQLVVHHKDGNGRGKIAPNNDIDNLVTECRKCHCNEHRKLLLQKRTENQQSQWSYKYDKCIICGTTERKHKAKGMCINCHAKYLREIKKMKI